jgi:hypothetical protein
MGERAPAIQAMQVGSFGLRPQDDSSEMTAVIGISTALH